MHADSLDVSLLLVKEYSCPRKLFANEDENFRDNKFNSLLKKSISVLNAPSELATGIFLLAEQ